MLHTMETNFLTHFLSQKSPTPSNTPKVIRDKVGAVEGLEKSRFPDSDLTPHQLFPFLPDSRMEDSRGG